jgi:hypothetical protein
MNHLYRLLARASTFGLIATVLAATCAASPVHALDSGVMLADRGVEPWKTCKLYGEKHKEYPCYLRFDLSAKKYGFHAGAGHGGSHDRVLDDGRHYSVDRCALAHDTHYWGKDNDRWTLECIRKVEPRTSEEKLAREEFMRLGPFYMRDPTIAGVAAMVSPRGWMVLPKDATDIRHQAAACYGYEKDKKWMPPTGKLIVGLRGFVLDVSGWDSSNGAKVIVWHENRECNQRWRFSAKTKEIRGLGGKCLETPGRVHPSAGTKVQMWDCNRGVNQKWHYENGQIRTENNLCLDVNREQTPGDVIVWSCGSKQKKNQQWTFK